MVAMVVTPVCLVKQPLVVVVEDQEQLQPLHAMARMDLVVVVVEHQVLAEQDHQDLMVVQVLQQEVVEVVAQEPLVEDQQAVKVEQVAMVFLTQSQELRLITVVVVAVVMDHH
jgi:hypothetical protein